MLVITHFGMRMLMRPPSKEAKLIEEKTDVPTIAARYGMHISLEERVRTAEPKKQADLSLFMGDD